MRDFTDAGTARRRRYGNEEAVVDRAHPAPGRLEQERLEEKDRKEERRRQRIAGVKPSGGRHDLVDRIERVTKYPMAVLGVAWLVIAIVIVTTDVNGSASIFLVGTLFVLWASCWSSTSCAWW